MRNTLPVALVLLLVLCASADPDRATRSNLCAAKTRILAADYRGDVDALARERDGVLALAGDPRLGYLAHYWAGYASWRIALNGPGHRMAIADLKANLSRAAADFEESVRVNDRFADGYAAAALVREWLVGLDRSNPDRDALAEHAKQARALLAKALQLEPENPRVLLLEGNDLFFAPPSMGGDRRRAIELYRRALALSPAPIDSGSPLPDWGKAEALMSLAFAHLNTTPPDVVAARQEAEEALRLQPQWSYVRDQLLPAIERASAK